MNAATPRFTRRLQELTFQTFERRWLEHLPSSGLDDEKTLVYSYVQPGIVSVFYSWLTDKMPNMSAEQLVCLLQKLILHGMTGLGEDLFPFGNSPGLTLPAASAIIGCSSISYMK